MFAMTVTISSSQPCRYPLLHSQVCTLHYTVERIAETDERSIPRATLHGETQRGRTTIPHIAFEPAVPHLKRSVPCDLWPADRLYLNPTFTWLQKLEFKYKNKILETVISSPSQEYSPNRRHEKFYFSQCYVRNDVRLYCLKKQLLSRLTLLGCAWGVKCGRYR